MNLYDLLQGINVQNWYLGEINALTAWNTNATMRKSDEQKVRRILRKNGYKCMFCGGILNQISRI